jgi:hypothetical protein
MKRAVAGIAVIILGLAGPAMAAEQSSATASSSQEVAIGSALTVTATETITQIGLVVTVTKTPGYVGSGSENTDLLPSFEIN